MPRTVLPPRIASADFREALKDFPGIRIVASDFGMADRDKAIASADRMLSTILG